MAVLGRRERDRQWCRIRTRPGCRSAQFRYGADARRLHCRHHQRDQQRRHHGHGPVGHGWHIRPGQRDLRGRNRHHCRPRPAGRHHPGGRHRVLHTDGHHDRHRSAGVPEPGVLDPGHRPALPRYQLILTRLWPPAHEAGGRGKGRNTAPAHKGWTMNRKLRATFALATVPAALALSATAASAAAGWHASGTGAASAKAGTWSTAPTATLTCAGLTTISWTAARPSQMTCSLQVTNTGSASETIALSAGTFTAPNHPATQTLSSPSTFTLAAGVSASDTLTITMPSAGGPGAQTASITASVGATVLATITETATVP